MITTSFSKGDKRWICGFILFLLGSLLIGQRSIHGIVRDSLTQESLPFTSVRGTGNLPSATADASGYFTLRVDSIQPGDSLYFSYVGYRPSVLSLLRLDLDRPNRIDLTPDADLPTVEVRATSATTAPSTTVLRPSVAELERTPAILGEVDLLKSLTLLPGISGGSEGTAALNIRGGNPNQTDLLVDGNRIYNVNHIGGFLSALPSFATKTVTVYKGGVPARYGGRLSGVVDVILKEGRRDRFSQSYTLGLGTLQAGLEGPVGEKSSFLLNGRYSYPILLYNLSTSGSHKRNEYGAFSTVGLYDVVGKFRREVGRHVVTASAFLSGDNGWDQEDYGVDVVTNDFGWGNRSFTVKHQYRPPGGGVWTNSAQYLNYRYENRQQQFMKPGQSFTLDAAKRLLINDLNDVSFNTEFARGIGAHLNVYGGLTAHGHLFGASVSDEIISDDKLVLFSREVEQDTVELAAYASADLRLARDQIQLMAGVRMSGLGFALPRNVEPRLRLSVNPVGNFFIHGSYDRHIQYVHQLTPEVAIFPNELYLLASDRFPAERSEQVAVGVAGRHGKLQWSVDLFRKHLDDLVRLNPGQERDDDFVRRFPENVIGGGRGKVEGLELYVKRESEAFSYSVAYTLSRSDRQYVQVNNGEWFPFTFDRTHDIGVTASQKLPRNWRMNLAFIYQSGHRFTAPVAISDFFYLWGDYNAARLPPFHVLNLSAAKSWTGKKRANRHHRLTLSTYNTYNRPNPYAVEIRPQRQRIVDAATGQEVTIPSYKALTYSLFPILPSINYSVTVN